MIFSQMIFGAVVVIAANAICGAQGIPKPQFSEVDGFSFNGPVNRSRPFESTNGPELDEMESTQPFAAPTIETSIPATEPSPDPLTDASATLPTANTPTIDPTSAQLVTQSPEVIQCTRNCQFRVTSEFNPVCGSDRSVYKNPGMLNCVKACGHNVDHAYFGPCSSQIRG